MQPGTHDHSIIGETGSDLRLLDILLSSFHEGMTLTVSGSSPGRENCNSDEHNFKNTASGKSDVKLCQVFPLISEGWSMICPYRSLGMVLKCLAFRCECSDTI